MAATEAALIDMAGAVLTVQAEGRASNEHAGGGAGAFSWFLSDFLKNARRPTWATVSVKTTAVAGATVLCATLVGEGWSHETRLATCSSAVGRWSLLSKDQRTQRQATTNTGGWHLARVNEKKLRQSRERCWRQAEGGVEKEGGWRKVDLKSALEREKR